MELRDATVEDFEELLPALYKAHQRSVFSQFSVNEAQVQRIFVTSIYFDDGYAKVVEKNGQILGGLVGVVAENQIGVKSAQDLFMYSLGGTDILVKDFMQWSKSRGAKFVQISDFSGSERYHSLLKALDLKPAGINFIGVL